MKTIINNIKEFKRYNLNFSTITINQDKQAKLDMEFKVNGLDNLTLSTESYLSNHFVFFNYDPVVTIYDKGIKLTENGLIKLNKHSFINSNLRPLRLINKWLKEEKLKIPFEEDELNTIRYFYDFTITIKFNYIEFHNYQKNTYFNWYWSNKKIDEQTQARKKQELITFIKELKYQEGNNEETNWYN